MKKLLSAHQTKENQKENSFCFLPLSVPLSGAEVMVAICDIFPQGTASSTHPPLPAIFLKKIPRYVFQIGNLSPLSEIYQKYLIDMSKDGVKPLNLFQLDQRAIEIRR